MHLLRAAALCSVQATLCARNVPKRLHYAIDLLNGSTVRSMKPDY